jgi:hypothetical protein
MNVIGAKISECRPHLRPRGMGDLLHGASAED